jgi:hypothetical protein
MVQPYNYYPQAPRARANGLALASLLVGIVGLALSWVPFVGLCIGIVALVLGVVASARIKRGASGSKASMITGIVLGSLALLVGAVVSFGLVFLVVQQQNCIDHAEGRGELAKCH